jgi:GT2 family glycosyltransferase
MSTEEADVAADTTVIIPTLGRAILEDCLERLLAGTTLPSEIVVVHQGSDERTAILCEEITARGVVCSYVPRADERGAARCRNRGIKNCRTRFFASIDDDCMADRHWLGTLVRVMREHPESIVTGQVLAGGEGYVPSVIGDPEPRIYRQPTRRRDVLFTGCMGCSTAVARTIGPFNEARALLPSAEDNEWAYRALTAGVPIRYEPAARVVHLDWRSPEEAVDVERRYSRGQGGFYGLYIRRRDGFVAQRAARDLMRNARMAISGIVRRDPSRARLGLLRLQELLRGIAAGLTEADGKSSVEGPRG